MARKDDDIYEPTAKERITLAYDKLSPLLRELADVADLCAESILKDEVAHKCVLPIPTASQAQERQVSDYHAEKVEYTCGCGQRWVYHFLHKTWHPKKKRKGKSGAK